MSSGRWLHQCSFQEVKSASPRLFQASRCPSQQSGPELLTCDGGKGKRNKNKRVRPLLVLHTTGDVPVSVRRYVGVTQGLPGWLHIRMKEAHGAKWEKEAGEDKRAPFPWLERSNVTYRGHERDDETEQPKETWRHSRTKSESRQSECVAICTVLSHPRAYPRPPLSLFRLSWTRPSSCAPCITSHAVTFEVVSHTDSF